MAPVASGVDPPHGMAGKRSNRVANSLVALGSAAVLTVYSAGYMRTRAAAQRFADESDRLRPVMPAPPATPVLRPAAPLAPVKAAELVAPASAPPPAPVSATPAPAKKAATAVKPAAPKPKSKPAAPVAGTNSPAGAPGSTETKPAEPASPPTPATTEPNPPTVEPAAPAPQSQYKDGTYTGWGTSRHGDIQATVIIEAGRIASATISRCLTRYSCSWISILPPQVVSRQSPEVDYVSGATQSTNAFYYAVVEALAKAR
jgi:uncharacterized protein with FMN-binding domain